ncbi:MAG: hypothetical protein EOP40_21295, partial [Rubrivivax sp.]
MPRLLPRFFLFLCLGPLLAGAQEPSRPALARRIDSMWAAARGPEAPPRLAALSTHQARHAALRGLLDREGYPGLREVGPDACEHFWNLLQAADGDPALQRRALGLLKEQVARQNAPARHLAWLQDRVLVNGGQPQWYGTQVRLNADSTSFEPRPVEDPAQLD